MKIDISSLPAKTGVYILKNKQGKIIYIGKSFHIRNRVRTHLKNESWHAAPGLPNPLAAETAKVDYIVTENEPGALIKESELIKKYKPRYNIMLRDDKQYFYVGFTREKLPRLLVTHQPKTYNLNPKTYAGPFTDGKSLKTVLRYLRKAFPYYTQAHRKLPCSYCHLGLCPGSNPNVSEYKKNISKIKQVLNGKRPRVISALKKEMAKLSVGLEFEKASKARDQIRALENIFSHRRPPLNLPLGKGENAPLAKHLPPPLTKGGQGGLDQLLSVNGQMYASLEAYDISNIQGREPVASMVRFDNGNPNKSLYRKFKIRLPEKPNDVAMIKEVIRRRLAHPEWPYPNTFLIDGGRGQLNAAFSELVKVTSYASYAPKVIALAKRFNELYVPGQKKPIPLNTLPKEVKNLLMHARDEAHRFAITYHRKLHGRVFQ